MAGPRAVDERRGCARNARWGALRWRSAARGRDELGRPGFAQPGSHSRAPASRWVAVIAMVHRRDLAERRRVGARPGRRRPAAQGAVTPRANANTTPASAVPHRLRPSHGGHETGAPPTGSRRLRRSVGDNSRNDLLVIVAALPRTSSRCAAPRRGRHPVSGTPMVIPARARLSRLVRDAVEGPVRGAPLELEPQGALTECPAISDVDAVQPWKSAVFTA